MMTPEVVEGVAGELIAKQLKWVLREIVRTAVKTPFDSHYFAVMLHQGISENLDNLKFNDIAKLLSCPTTTVHGYLAEHMIYGSARGGCRVCNGASKELQSLITEEKGRSRDTLSVFITIDSLRSSRRR